MDDRSGLARLTLGLTFARSSANTPIYTLRGIEFNTPNLSSTSPVGLYVDEVAYAYPYMGNGPLFDVERVEVLKGPHALGWAVNNAASKVYGLTKVCAPDHASGHTRRTSRGGARGGESIPRSRTFGRSQGRCSDDSGMLRAAFRQFP